MRFNVRGVCFVHLLGVSVVDVVASVGVQQYLVFDISVTSQPVFRVVAAVGCCGYIRCKISSEPLKLHAPCVGASLLLVGWRFPGRRDCPSFRSVAVSCTPAAVWCRLSICPICLCALFFRFAHTGVLYGPPLTNIRYGDVLPVEPLSRMLMVSEMLCYLLPAYAGAANLAKICVSAQLNLW